MIAVLALYGMLLQSFFAGIVGASGPVALPLDAQAQALCIGGQTRATGEAPAPPHSGAHDCVCAAMCHGGHGALAGGPGHEALALMVASLKAPSAPSAHPLSPQTKLPHARGPPHDDRASFA